MVPIEKIVTPKLLNIMTNMYYTRNDLSSWKCPSIHGIKDNDSCRGCNFLHICYPKTLLNIRNKFLGENYPAKKVSTSNSYEIFNKSFHRYSTRKDFDLPNKIL